VRGGWRVLWSRIDDAGFLSRWFLLRFTLLEGVLCRRVVLSGDVDGAYPVSYLYILCNGRVSRRSELSGGGGWAAFPVPLGGVLSCWLERTEYLSRVILLHVAFHRFLL
jgi:hypothetical protein